MNRTERMLMNRSRQQGQTLIIAILILGVLLILGVAFAGIISRNITETGRSAQRTVASDLSQAGIKFAHDQMLNGSLGADWRPANTALTVDGAGFTKDPDALYLRPGSGFFVEVDPVGKPGYLVEDLGGPDYLGAYSRVGFGKGRSLLRVRYSPSAYDAFGASTGALRDAGKARGHIIIESVGRAGAIDDQGRIDPSKLLDRNVQATLFADGNAVRNGLGVLKAVDAGVTNSRRMIAFASIGFMESARYITNKYNRSQSAQIGTPTSAAGPLFNSAVGIGATYEGNDVNVPQQFGRNQSGAATIAVDQGRWDLLPGGGSIWVNGSLEVFGQSDIFINRQLGESINVTDGIRPANNSSAVNLHIFGLDGTSTNWREWQVGLGDPVNSPQLVAGNGLNSNNANFSTLGGVIKDGRLLSDLPGFNRMTAVKAAPSVSATDPQTGDNRYRELSQRTGALGTNGHLAGEFGHGEGVYVDSPERGNRSLADQRKGLDPLKSLPNDWLNPNNASSQGWQGQYYIPNAPYVRLLPDGFEIIRDSRSSSATWKDVNGVDTAQTLCRYWIRTIGNQNYIVNSIANPAFDPLTGNFATNGQLFNGVLLFEGDVRVRGVIPTDQQLTLVSMGSIYIEGSITKGIFDPWTNTVLTRPSTSLCALLAKDFVTINPTMFFGPEVGESPKPKTTNPLPNTPNPIELDGTSSPELLMTSEMLLNPVGNNPANWTTFAEQYVPSGGLGEPGALDSNILVSVSADDNGPGFLGMDIISGTFRDATPTATRYLYPRAYLGVLNNDASPYFGGAGNIPSYGLGDPALNAYPKFQTWAMPLVNLQTPGGVAPYNSAGSRKLEMNPAAIEGLYDLSVQDPTFFRMFLNPVGGQPTKNVLIARTAITPFDVRIEAVMYAENGSFFVIPGQWFNTNPEDTRANFEQNYTPSDTTDDLNTAALDYDPGQTVTVAGVTSSRRLLAQQRRVENFGASAEVPFYGEPLACRITMVGSISENMTAPMAMQTEWLKKWGWMPRRIGGTGRILPAQHVPTGYSVATNLAVPNLNLIYDPVLATAAVPVSDAANAVLQSVRRDNQGRILPPAPRLPVSPTLAYFGDINP